LRLIDRIAKREPEASRAEIVMTQTWSPQNTERIAPDFVSWVTEGYAGNPVVAAVVNARLNLFTEANFKFRSLADKKLYGNTDLSILENPWPNGSTGELLARMEQDVFFAGNAFVRKVSPTRLERLRPDRVKIVTVVDEITEVSELFGYTYARNGLDDEEFYPPEEMAHWSPLPDPLANFKGMSPLSSVVRDVNNDAAMTEHKTEFFKNAATPNMVVKNAKPVDSAGLTRIRERFNARYAGTTGDKTMILADGWDATVVGNSFEHMTFTALQSAGETRIAAAASVPPIVAGLQAGLDAATYSNYREAFKAFGSGFMRSHWRSVCAALAPLVNVPNGAELWFDTSDIAALQEAETERAAADSTRMQAINSAVMNGWTPESAKSAIISGDLSLLTHTGALSVQLYPNGVVPDGKAPTP